MPKNLFDEDINELGSLEERYKKQNEKVLREETIKQADKKIASFKAKENHDVEWAKSVLEYDEEFQALNSDVFDELKNKAVFEEIVTESKKIVADFEEAEKQRILAEKLKAKEEAERKKKLEEERKAKAEAKRLEEERIQKEKEDALVDSVVKETAELSKQTISIDWAHNVNFLHDKYRQLPENLKKRVTNSDVLNDMESKTFEVYDEKVVVGKIVEEYNRQSTITPQYLVKFRDKYNQFMKRKEIYVSEYVEQLNNIYCVCVETVYMDYIDFIREMDIAKANDYNLTKFHNLRSIINKGYFGPSPYVQEFREKEEKLAKILEPIEKINEERARLVIEETEKRLKMGDTSYVDFSEEDSFEKYYKVEKRRVGLFAIISTVVAILFGAGAYLLLRFIPPLLPSYESLINYGVAGLVTIGIFLTCLLAKKIYYIIWEVIALSGAVFIFWPDSFATKHWIYGAALLGGGFIASLIKFFAVKRANGLRITRRTDADLGLLFGLIGVGILTWYIVSHYLPNFFGNLTVIGAGFVIYFLLALILTSLIRKPLITSIIFGAIGLGGVITAGIFAIIAANSKDWNLFYTMCAGAGVLAFDTLFLGLSYRASKKRRLPGNILIIEFGAISVIAIGLLAVAFVLLMWF